MVTYTRGNNSGPGPDTLGDVYMSTTPAGHTANFGSNRGPRLRRSNNHRTRRARPLDPRSKCFSRIVTVRPKDSRRPVVQGGTPQTHPPHLSS